MSIWKESSNVHKSTLAFFPLEHVVDAMIQNIILNKLAKSMTEVLDLKIPILGPKTFT